MCKLSYSTPKDRSDLTIKLGIPKVIKLSRIINNPFEICDDEGNYFFMRIYESNHVLNVFLEFKCGDVSLSFDAEIKRFDKYDTFILVDLQRFAFERMPAAMIINRDQIYLENIQ